ncbi:ORF2 [torque teno Delphinidae virus 1]
MGLTLKENAWLTGCFLNHNLFCDCGDPQSHLARCLIIQGEEDAIFAAAMDSTDRIVQDGGSDLAGDAVFAEDTR